MAIRAKTHLQDMRDRGIIGHSNKDYEQKRLSDPKLAMAKRIRSSRRWQRTRATYIAEHPVCGDILNLHPGQVRPTTQVHHIDPIQERPDLAFNKNNLWHECDEGHAAIEQMERYGVGEGVRQLIHVRKQGEGG